MNFTPHLLLAALLAAVPTTPAAIQPVGLLCEYRDHPVGIDSLQPRLSWRLASTEHGARQSAYRILVASAREKLDRDEADLWDSGRVESDQSLHVRYAGSPLEARQEVFWKVRTWDGAGGESAWSPVATWEMGLPDAAAWGDARWIQLAQDTRTSPFKQRLLDIEKQERKPMVEVFPAPMFRREFEVKPGVVRARAYLSGLGLAELSVNGRRVGDAVLEPAQTTYDVRACYVTHDLAPFLRPGRNAVGIQLGNGFFGQNVAFGAAWLAWGRPVVIAKLVVDYDDGTSMVVITDASWKAETGPIVYDNIYAGETYDARLERSGWDQPGYNDSAWAQAVEVASPAARLEAQMIDPIRPQETLSPQRVFPGRDGKWIFDFGRNIAGWPKLSIEAPSGTQLTLKCAEILSPDGRQLDHGTTGRKHTGVEQTAIYLCKGGGIETWEPRFAYHGFRYIEVEGLSGRPAPGFLEAVVVYNDVARRGSFTSSDDLLNRIYQTSLHTLEGNLHSTLTDCPHREKCGWLGDAHAAGEAAIFNYDMAQFWTKFVDDIETVLGRGGQTYWQQKATPGIPCNIALGRRLCQEARPDWGSAYILLPWYLQTYYGDTAVFARHYEHLRRWIDYVKELREEGIVTRGYGDWCPPGGNDNMECPQPLTTTAFFYATLDIMADFARQLGKTGDAEYFARLAAETRAAFNRKFFGATTGGYGSQTANAVALRFGLPPEGKTGVVAESLAREVAERHKGHAFVGIHGGRPIFSQLAEHGRMDLALAALKKDTWPGHAYTLNQGFTTWPEVADEVIPGAPNTDRSLNHPMHSGFAAFFHESLGGIRPAAPGFKHIHLKPHGFHQLESVEVFHDSLYGRIESRWQSRGGRFHWAVRVPPNTTATAWLPGRAATAAQEGGRPLSSARGVRMVRQDGDRLVLELESGAYDFTSELPELFLHEAGGGTASVASRPNVLLVFTDDQGYADLSIHGVDPDVRTPNMDRLARDGVLFRRGYVTAPQCVPSRAGLISGRHQNAFGVDDNNLGPLPHDEYTIAERLRDAGYVTGMVGKWHLDLDFSEANRVVARPDHLPHRHGFEEYFCGSMNQYHASHDLEGRPLENPPRVIDDARYRVDVQTEAALSFLDRRRKDDRPFFLYLAYFAPHAPMQDPPEYMARVAHVKERERRMGLASLLAMDDGVGRIRGKLEEMGVTTNTLVFYISDNGAPLREGAYIGSLNTPMIGEKGMQTDGGQRVPFVAAWPGRIPAGQVFDEAVWQLDATATALAAAGAPVDDRIEGVNLLPWLTGQRRGPVHDALYWRWRSQAAILSGHWKFIRLGNEERYLFDLRESGKETAADNKLGEHPEIARALEQKLRARADTWKTPGLPDTVVRPDRLFYDLHVERTLPPPPLGQGKPGGYVPFREKPSESAPRRR